MRKGILKKSCAWLLTLVTVLSTVFTSTTGLFADETDTSATEVVSHDTTETTATEEPTVDETVEVAEPTTQGSIYVKLNEGGIVIVTYGDNKQTIQKSGGKVTVTDNKNVTVDVTDSLANDYYLVATEGVDSVMTTEVKSLSGYSVETYRILSDAGEVVEDVQDFATLSSNYRREVSVTQTSKYIEVGFKADEVVEETTEETTKETNEETEVREPTEEVDSTTFSDGYPIGSKYAIDYSTVDVLGTATFTETESSSSNNFRLYAERGANGSVTITQNGKHVFAHGLSTNEFALSNGVVGICIEGSKASPGGITQDYGIANNNMLLAALLTAPVGNGTESDAMGAYRNDGVWAPMMGIAPDNFFAVHAVASYLNGDGISGAFLTLYQSKMDAVVANLSAWCDANGSVLNRSTLYATIPSTSAIQSVAWCTTTFKTTGYIHLNKSTASGYECITGNSMYSLEGAVYGVYSDAGCTNQVATLTTDASGSSNTIEVEQGSYWVKEITAPKGYQLDTHSHDVTVTVGDTTQVNLSDTPGNDPAILLLSKQPNSNMTTATGNTKLEGAEYTLKYYDNMGYSGTPVYTVVYRTNSKGRISFEAGIPISGSTLSVNGKTLFFEGSYTLQETKAPTGYNIDTTLYKAKVSSDSSETGATWSWDGDSPVKSYNSATQETALAETPWSGAGSVRKVDAETNKTTPQGDANLSTTFTIVNASANPVSYKGKIIKVGDVVTTITTGSDGTASTPAKSLEFGTYKIYESSNNGSYLLSDTSPRTIKITKDGQVVNVGTVSNNVVRGDVKITKQDYELHKTSFVSRISRAILGKDAQGDASLEGIQFQITNASAKEVKVDGVMYKPGKVVKTITTSYKGNEAVAKTTGNTLPYGTYTIKEVATNNSYLMTDGTTYTFRVRSQGTTVTGDVSGKSLTFNDNVIRGGVKLQKNDEELSKAYSQGGATLAGAVYTITNDSASNVLVDGVLYKPGEIVKRITTDAKGYAATATNSLPYGTYHIVEETPSKGYLLDEDFYQSFTIRTSGQVVDLTTSARSSYEPVIRGGVQVQKWDLELNKSEAIGGAEHGDNTSGTHLEGIQFAITNTSTNNVYVEGHEYAPGTVVKTIKTHWNEEKKAYTAETSSDCLPYGTYTIQEVKTTPSYLLTDGVARTFQIRTEGQIVTKDTSNSNLVFKDQVVRGDIEWVKIADTTSRRISAPFVITNITTGEQHVAVTDANGQFNTNSTWNKHSTNTNSNDWVLDTLKTDPEHCFTEAELDTTAGVWFGLGEDGSVASVQNSLGALPYGDYIISEIRCEANSAFRLQTFTFTVYKDSTTVDLGTVTNDEEKPTISTKAWDSESKYQVSMADEEATVIDTVHMVGLVIGDTYTLKGKLMDFEDEDVAMKAKGRNIKGETTFVATKGVMDVDVEFRMDASTFKNRTGVVYEYLYRDGSLVATETNVDEVTQRIWFPEITTSALDGYTGDEVATNTNQRIIDTVSYTNVQPDVEYSMQGTLVNKETNEAIATANTVFTPTGEDGTIDVVFNFTGDTAGNTYVAVENLVINNATVATHNDMEDEKQTVYFPKVSTSAIDSATNTHVGVVGKEAKITDNVTYSNLVIGKEYTLSGTLMDKATGQPVLVEDKPVTASKTFTAETIDGTVSLDFVVDSSTLAGETLVVFEDLIHNSVTVATHSDIEDKEQSILFPEISTTASDIQTTDSVGVVGNTTIKDTVSYENLVVGQEYTLSGVLMDKETKEYLGKDLGLDPIKATTTFTPETVNGSIELLYVVDSSLMGGKTTVVFEDLLVNGVIVRSHADLEDKNQTVYFPKIRTNAVTADGINESLAGQSQTILDTVTYSNLVVGKEYTVSGKLMIKETGKALLVDGKEVTAETIFTPEKSSGSVELSFTISDTSALEGKTVVAYEDLIHNGITVTTHSDIKDYDQSIKFPKVRTSAVDYKTGLDEGLSEKNATITDTVYYENLEEGATYSIKGTVVDKETGNTIVENNKELVVESTFVAGSKANLGSHKSVSGTTSVNFTVDASLLSGKSVVIYEDIYRDGIKVGTHTDLTDESQDVKYPEIGTKAINKETGLDEADAATTCTVVDTVSYKNLTIGNTYTLSAILMDKDTNKALLVDGKEVTATKTFTATSTSGNIDVEISVDASQLSGKTVVAYETLYREGKQIAIHADLTDIPQTVYFPAVSTKAVDKATNFNEGIIGESTTLVDTVSYSNLTGGRTYTLKGKVMDKETGKPLLVDNKEVTSEVTFVAGDTSSVGTRVSASASLEFSFDSSELAGKDVVIFEELYTSDKLVGHHTDISDENQTVSFPKVETTALDGKNETHEQQANEKATIVDTVSYANLTVGKEYTIKGVLMNQKTGEALLIDGEEVIASTKFTSEKANGSVDITFKLDSSELAGTNVVAFETVYRDGFEVATHSDIGDEDQTVSVINIKTTATDGTTKTKEQQAGSESVIKDIVSYTNLTVGEEYTVKGTLMNKESGKPITVEGKEVTAKTIFTPEKVNGTTKVTFKLDSSALEGIDVVVFEDLYNSDNVLIATHSDIGDEDQTVSVINIKTTATDKASGSKEMALGSDVVLVDTVEYTNLTVGKSYSLKGNVVDKETGESVGSADATFKPESENGSTTVEFNLNTESLEGKTLVVFEELYNEDNTLIATHKDINDEGQTVTVPVPPTIVKTGDTFGWLAGVGSVILLMGIAFVLFARRKKKVN